MRMTLKWLATAVLACNVPLPQSAFDLADVHVSPHSNNPAMRGGIVLSGQYELRTATMLDLISQAYDIKAANIAGRTELAGDGSLRHYRESSGKHATGDAEADASKVAGR